MKHAARMEALNEIDAAGSGHVSRSVWDIPPTIRAGRHVSTHLPTEGCREGYLSCIFRDLPHTAR